MKAVHQWATYRSRQSECLPEVHLPIHFLAASFRICSFPPLPHTAQKILMRVHVCSRRARVLLTLYLKQGWNLTHGAVVLMWHFLRTGIFTHRLSAVRRWLRILCGCFQWGCFSIQPLLHPPPPHIYCCLIGYRTFFPTLIYVLTVKELKYSQQPRKAFKFLALIYIAAAR